MAEIRQFGHAGSAASRQSTAHKFAPKLGSAANPEKYCVYNKTRERFVATDVGAVDASPGGTEARLRTLEQGAGAGLWILPYVEISSTSIRFPLDLVFLNNDCVVLDLVESFPLGSLPASSAKAFSLLALPADTAATGEMAVGDQLIISEPDEMKRLLRKMKEAKTEAQGALGSVLDPFARKPSGEQAGRAGEEPARRIVEPEPTAPVETAQTGAASSEIVREELPAVATTPTVPPVKEDLPWEKEAKSRSWFTRLLLGNPKDPRKATREEIPGLIAYYFTGGTPEGFEVRDISSTGIYIVTQHRFYPGTVVRVTLTDRHLPTPERTITVNAKAVRLARDGVGLEFILGTETRKKGDLPPLEEQTLGMDRDRIEAFLQKLKTPRS
jgi:hypothetical protein